MKIMIISSLFPPGFRGGYELAALDMARGLKQKGHDICVLTSDYFLDYHQAIPDFPVHRVLEMITHFSQHMFYGRDLVYEGFFVNFRNIRLISSFLMDFRPDAVLFFDSRGLGTLGLLKYVIQAGFRTILNLGDNIFDILNNHYSEFSAYCSVFGDLDFLSQAKIIFLSQRIAGEITDTLGFKLPDQIILPRWYQDSQQQSPCFEKKFGHETRFIFASTLMSHKGIFLIVDAVKNLLLAGYKNFVVDFYGNGAVAEFIDNIAVNGLEQNMRYCRLISREELAAVLIDYDALLFPTWSREPFGAIVAEAAGAGCIPLMTRGIGASEWFLDELDCIKINQNSADLTAAMVKFLEFSKEEKTAMSTRTVATAAKFFKFSNILDATEQVISSMVQRPANDSLACPIQTEMDIFALKPNWETKIYAA